LFLNLSNNHRQSLLPKEEIVSIAKIKTVIGHFVVDFLLKILCECINNFRPTQKKDRFYRTKKEFSVKLGFYYKIIKNKV